MIKDKEINIESKGRSKKVLLYLLLIFIIAIIIFIIYRIGMKIYYII